MDEPQASNDYSFLTIWRVAGGVDEVTEILGDGESLPRWWPAVYLDVRSIQAGDEQGVGRVLDLHTKGWLPYTLRWKLTVTEPITTSGFALTADGDLVGTGRWTFVQDGPEVVITYAWNVSANKPLLRRFSGAFKPAFAANHRWAMAKGEESLRLEMRRRRASTEQQRAEIPPPPRPTFARGRSKSG